MEDARCWLEIDLDALDNNWAALQTLLRPGCTPIGVVKSNCYGLGAVPIARELEALGCVMLSTADMAEAMELRRAGIRLPILLLCPLAPGDVPQAIRENVITPVVDLPHALLLEEAARAYDGTLRTHIKVDVGLTRLGIPVPGREEQAANEVLAVAVLEHLTNEGLMTHISGMMDPRYDYLNLRQIELFRRLAAELGRRGFAPKLHCESSLLFLTHPEYQMDYVRLTSAFLGIQEGGRALGAACVARLKTRILQIKRVPEGTSMGYWMTYVARRDMTIAVVGAGYGDGLIRSLCQGAEMQLYGHRVPVVGKLSMSSAILDVTDLPQAAVGDEVTIFGGSGAGAVSIQDYARLYGGHPCEVIAMLKERIPKIYTGGRSRMGCI